MKDLFETGLVMGLVLLMLVGMIVVHDSTAERPLCAYSPPVPMPGFTPPPHNGPYVFYCDTPNVPINDGAAGSPR